MIKPYLFTLFFISVFSISYGQEQKSLPHTLSESEKSILQNYQFRSSTIATPPPSTAVRAAAEWEEVEYLVITWASDKKGILKQIVAAAVNECKVIITTQDQSTVAAYLTAAGIPLTNVIFMNAPWNSIWIRDYAGNTVYSNDVGDRALVDWIYNRPRPNDDLMPVSHATITGIPLFRTISGTTDLVNTGGNFMSDGMGTAFASALILNENETGNPYGVSIKTETQIDGIMQDYMGINRFIKMNTLPYDQIHHIDMHMKLLDEETILVSKYPTGVADGPQIEANINYVLNTYQSPFGTPYKIKWMMAPPSSAGDYPDANGSYRTFTNAVFINKSIIIPTYRPEVDTPAIAQWKALMPGYNIVGIDVDDPGENLIGSLGAIHCITHTIGVENPLWIVHQPIAYVAPGTSVSVKAQIKHNSNINQAKVFYRASGTTNFLEASMSLTNNDNWTANIITPTDGKDVEYYIWAKANSGKTLTRPIVAPQGYWTMNNSALSINKFEESNITGPFPNPTTTDVSFTFSQLTGKIQISIHNLLGQKLFETEVESSIGTFTLPLDSQWKGTLVITFKSGAHIAYKKIIKY
ncbi:MAG TPA: agmatine deiminase family protein [Edaphocola sp.]|nr:agmatine deiminase family protein [Edaphocola sp.]